ncbi:MAG: ATP-binding protein [Planctomycetota bacterium]|nr:ATP-binding protein [Planctomycetota bacterium]
MPNLARTIPSPGAPSGRTALFLYVLLVVLPAVVFGGLLWRQLQQFQDARLAELPLECRDAAERLARRCVDRVEKLRNDEMQRPFEHYAEDYFVDELGPVRAERSPLVEGEPTPGVLGHFAFSVVDDPIDREDGIAITVLRGRGVEADDAPSALIRDAVADALVAPIADAPFPAQVARDAALIEGFGERRERLIRSVVLNFAGGDEQECVDALDRFPELRAEVVHAVHVQYFELQPIPRGASEAPLLLATRQVTAEQLPEFQLPDCIDAINKGVLIVQGFALDPDWLYVQMPRAEARDVLGSSQRLVLGADELPEREGLAVEVVDVLGGLGVTGEDERSPGPRLAVVADAGELRRNFREQNASFASMALILTVSMVIGIRLLLGSIRQSRNEAFRTRNFVASVTHELRTPVAAVKLYGEMLRDGWVSDEARRDEYLGRIVTESDRLGSLVDRVLLRRRLYDQAEAPQPGDLNAEIVGMRRDLEILDGRAVQDVTFDLAEELPKVLLVPDGVYVVLQNLVENARKYAPVELSEDGQPVGEPIAVRTRLSRKGRVLLEVLDRGPGIPEKDRSRIFEAFLRLGDEQTRSTTGTGLGLHLVSLQARAMRARVRALPREGGGTVFQVVFSS